MCIFSKPAIALRDFTTFADLDAWFNLHTELRMEPPNLCDDYSRESRALAEADGYYLSLALVANGVIYMTQVMPAGTYHVANMAVITDVQEIWYVDLAFNLMVKLTDLIVGGKY